MLDRHGGTAVVATHEPEWFAAGASSAGARQGGWVRAYRALLRKDLLLELRGRELVPAMLAFVMARC